VPEILEEECTGCGLCEAVCPVPGSLNYVPRKTPYKPNRGTEPSDTFPKEQL